MVHYSDSFSTVWPNLAESLGIALEDLDGRDPTAAGPDVAAFVLAAGGAEHAALEWLDGHAAPSGVPTFVVGADLHRRMAAQVVARGAADYFALPDDLEILRNAMDAAAERCRLQLRRNSRVHAQPKDSAFAEIVGDSAALREVLVRAAKILPRPDATVLIVGETGTGKELLARALHDGGPRRANPFVAVNCSALPDRLIESELFGHERGAFTDARASKPGLFEVADGGTLFLDEVGDLPLEVQAKFLRVLQDREIRRVGGTKSRTVDVRIVAATNSDLRLAVKERRFREDLYFRLGVITLSLPPLRDRGEDVVVIAQALFETLAAQHGLPTPPIEADARRALFGYHWPGNVRELRNAVERALLLSPEGSIDLDELRPSGDLETAPAGPLPFPAKLDDIAAAAAHAAVNMAGGNRSEAARRLGISRRRLRRLLDEGAETDNGGVGEAEE